MAAGLSVARLQTVAVAGAGAVACSYVQAAVGTAVSPLWRDAGIAVGAAVLASQGGESLRPFALGVGAVAVGSIITSFLAPSV